MLPDAVKHVPRGFLGDAEFPCELAGRDALGVGNYQGELYTCLPIQTSFLSRASAAIISCAALSHLLTHSDNCALASAALIPPVEAK